MKRVEARVNTKAGGNKCYRFNENNENFYEVWDICSNCKFFDSESVYPNCFCDESGDLIDYWYYPERCPLGKFEIYDPTERK